MERDARAVRERVELALETQVERLVHAREGGFIAVRTYGDARTVERQSVNMLGGVVGEVCLRKDRREEPWGRHEDDARTGSVRRAERDPGPIAAGRDERRVGVADGGDVHARDHDDVAAIRL